MASLLLLQALSSLCMWPELWQTTPPVRAAQEPSSAVWEGETPVLPAKLSSYLGWEPPFSLSFNWGLEDEETTCCWLPKTSWAETRLTEVFVLLGTEESLCP